MSPVRNASEMCDVSPSHCHNDIHLWQQEDKFSQSVIEMRPVFSDQ